MCVCLRVCVCRRMQPHFVHVLLHGRWHNGSKVVVQTMDMRAIQIEGIECLCLWRAPGLLDDMQRLVAAAETLSTSAQALAHYLC